MKGKAGPNSTSSAEGAVTGPRGGSAGRPAPGHLVTEQLLRFVEQEAISDQGSLSMALVVTRHARLGLPARADQLLTSSGCQVKGLGRPRVRSILASHGIARPLSSECGRTSMLSVPRMKAYVAFLNSLPPPVNLEEVEAFWISRFRGLLASSPPRYPAGQPFKFRADASLSIRAAVRDLLRQARQRQQGLPGSRHEGAMLQHLVGAKLDLLLPPGSVSHHPAAEADQAEGRAGDFLVGDVAVHVTTHPGEALVRRCAENLAAGLRPLVVTLPKQAEAAEDLAENAGLGDRVDVLDVEQFLCSNLLERSLFQTANRRARAAELLARYNALVEAHEHDPALKIELAGA